MTMGAQVVDFSPTQFRHKAKREQIQPLPGSAVEDMADGILALDFALTFAGYSYEARQLTLSIVGLLGGGESELIVFDKELSEHLKCSDRTIRRWRQAHIKESKAKKFALLQIEESDYNADLKRYEKTVYRFVGPEYVNSVVASARASDLYGRDRREALERASEEFYSEIPDAPPRERTRKPKRAPTVKLEQDFINAAKNVGKGRAALDKLKPESRDAFLASRQGAELRELLLKLQSDIADVLEDFPQDIEDVGLDEGVGHNVRYPPDDLEGHEAETRVRGNTRENTRTLVPPEVEPTPEAVAAFDAVCRRVRGEPAVRSVILPLHKPPEPTVEHDENAPSESLCRGCLKVCPPSETSEGICDKCAGDVCGCSWCVETIRLLRDGERRSTALGLRVGVRLRDWGDGGGQFDGVPRDGKGALDVHI